MRASFLCSCVAFLLVVTACAGSGEEDEIDAMGTLAFVSGEPEGRSAIFVTNADGTERRRLARERIGVQAVPKSRIEGVEVMAWSPDGAEIAYSGGRGHTDLYVVRVAGGRARLLSHSPTKEDWNPAWSPDGRKIAFERHHDGFNWIYVVNADGTGLRRLTAVYNWLRTWTPDGRITFYNARGTWVMNSDGSGKRRTRVEGEKSPDGTKVAFSTGTAMWVMEANGHNRRKLYGDPNRTTSSPVWSPDGKTLAWTPGDGDFEVFVVRADGSGLRNVTDNDGLQRRPEPTWSPDGRALAFVCQLPDATTEICVMNADGSGERNVSQTPADDWSPVWSPTPTGG
jgi:TolB protein